MIGQFRKRSKVIAFLSALPLVFVLALLFSMNTWAQEGEEEPAAGETSGAATQGAFDDGGDWELGIHGTAGDLTSATAAERAGMSFWLAPASNWVQRYSFAESTAWEKDFKRSALGGWENSYIDSVDLQFYVGHGWPGGFTFATNNRDDGSLVPNDCFQSWGDRDNEWLALTSCQVMADSNLSQWASCMEGQHLIMGFVTNASAYNNLFSTQAYHFGRYIQQNYSMPQAWYKACDVAQRGRVTRTIINELACLNDKPNLGQVCADSYDSDWWYQTHSCGTETATFVPADDISAMPVFVMQPYALDDLREDAAKLEAAFGVSISETVSAAAFSADDNPILVSDVNSRTLEIDKNSGLFSYSDLNQLWSTEQAVEAMGISAAAANYISNDDARAIADAFLRNTQLNGDGAVFYEVISDTISSVIDPTDINAASTLTEATQTPLVWQVIYSRRLTAPALNAAGVMDSHEFSVVGPGAKQKVYVPVAAPVGAASVLDTAPIGVQAGWRGIQQGVDAATGEALLVTIFTPAQIQELYAALNEEIALHDLPLDIKSREVLSYTVAYWEEPIGVSQGEMIPVYELKVKMVEAQSDAEIEEFVYVPANETYMRPIARISSVISTPVQAGTVVTLTAADAKQTLRTLGIADFDIVLGRGDYSYGWYVGGELVGSGQTYAYTVPFAESDRDFSVLIELRVTDIAAANDSFSTDSIKLTSDRATFLPLVER